MRRPHSFEGLMHLTILHNDSHRSAISKVWTHAAWNCRLVPRTQDRHGSAEAQMFQQTW